MRVLYFSAGFGPHDHRFLASLARTRHEVYFLRLQRRSLPGDEPAVPAGIHEVVWAGLQDRFCWRKVPGLVGGLRRVIRQVSPDLVHAGPIQTCAFLAVLSGSRPVLTMSWGFDLMEDAERSRLCRWVTRYTLRRSAFFVSDAKVTRDKAISYGMPPDRTAVFPWGVDLRRFHPRVGAVQRSNPATIARGRRASPARRQGRPGIVLLCNRSWEERYGVDVLARAFVLATRRLPGASLILLGDGSQGATIREILEQGGQSSRVLFGGRIPQARIHSWYQKADLYISPSHIDGSSVSLMEALASGTPVLVSDIPANREWVSDDVNGWLFRDGDAKHLAERIVWIASHPAKLQRIGLAARRTAEDRADWSHNFKVLLDSYERVIAQGGKS